MLTTWSQFYALKESPLLETSGPHKFSCVMYNFPDKVANQVIKFGKSIDDKEIHSEGREDEIHVTVLYGIHDTKPDDTFKLLETVEPFKVTLGKTSVFKLEKYDVLKIDVISPEIKKVNRLLRDNLEYSSNFPDYKPHVTVAYLLPGTGSKYANKNTFSGMSALADSLIFSSSDGNKTKFTLNT